MTPEQQTALEALAGRALTQPEVEQIEALLPARRDDLIAALLSTGRTERDAVTKFTSLGISERYPDLGGLPGPLAAELAFQKLEGFAAQAVELPDLLPRLLGGAIKRQMSHLGGGGMAIGSPAITGMLSIVIAQTVQAGASAFTQAEADALQDVARVPAPITTNSVSDALNGA